MTQQPYPAQYPGQPQQPYAAQPPVQYPPQQPGYGQAPYAPQPAYAPQPGYGQPPMGQPAPQVPLANGTLDDFFNQPGAGTGPSLSWKDKPVGASYAGIVARDVAQGDIQQETDPTTNAPKFFKDGRPKFVMKVPLKVQPSAEFPEGEATFYVRGQSRDELVRAMSEAGSQSNVPRGGDAMQVTLVQRRPSRMGNPANIVQIRYTVGQGGAGAPSPAPAPVQQQAPAQPVPEAQYQPPTPQIPQYAPQPVQQYEQPPVQQHAPQPESQYQAPVQQIPQQVPAQQPVQQQVPQQAAPPAPAGLDPEQQRLLAELTGGAPAA